MPFVFSLSYSFCSLVRLSASPELVFLACITYVCCCIAFSPLGISSEKFDNSNEKQKFCSVSVEGIESFLYKPDELSEFGKSVN